MTKENKLSTVINKNGNYVEVENDCNGQYLRRKLCKSSPESSPLGSDVSGSPEWLCLQYNAGKIVVYAI